MKLTFWNLYFKVLIRPHYQGNDYQFTKYCQKRRNHRFQEVFCCSSSERDFGVLTIKFAREPYCGPKYGQFAKHCHGHLIHRFLLVFWYVSCKQYFGVLEAKFLLNKIMTYKMASLENTVTRLRIIFLS